MSRPKVLQVVSSLGMGGAETWLMELLRYWSRRGGDSPEIQFLAASGERDFFDAEAESLGARIHYIRYGRSNAASFARRFRRLLRAEKFQAIHDHQDYSSGWHYLLGWGALPPVRVTHVHNPWQHIFVNYAVSRTRWRTAMTGKWLARRFATHICGTSAELLGLYGFPPNPPAVRPLHCGIDVAKWVRPRAADRASVLEEFQWPADARIALFVGRLDRALEFDHPQNHKNSWLALNAVRAAAATDSSIRLLLAGAGESKPELERAVRDWGLADRIRLLGIRSDVARLMSAADLLFFPSKYEGLGMAAVEAQAAGLPVLASDAVPRECIVIPELYRSLPLSAPLSAWAEQLLATPARQPERAAHFRAQFAASPFSIENSAAALAAIYAGRHVQ